MHIENNKWVEFRVNRALLSFIEKDETTSNLLVDLVIQCMLAKDGEFNPWEDQQKTISTTHMKEKHD